MAPQDKPGPGSPAADAHRLARLLRHEVGDLLQSVYSTVGILLERLPEALNLERRLVSDLKSRAELCKLELDAVVEVVAPAILTAGRVDLMSAVHSALLQVRRRFPGLQVHFESAGPAFVSSDARALASCISVLFLAVCQGAQKQVWVRVLGGDKDTELSLQRDGYAATAEQLSWMEHPFATTQNALFGLGLSLAQRLVNATGGEVAAANIPEGGVSIKIRFPAAS
jgi:C4-dicarboxylate-specific signal transduction histidine kinase